MKMMMRPTVPACAVLCSQALNAVRAGLHSAWVELRTLGQEVDEEPGGAASTARSVPMTAHAYLAVGTLMIPQTRE
ncbi:aspartate aminotransferase family protein [Pseudomonas sp. S37]|nr:aspartate aminotransferase family protein [Pseudomonas sp. S37]